MQKAAVSKARSDDLKARRWYLKTVKARRSVRGRSRGWENVLLFALASLQVHRQAEPEAPDEHTRLAELKNSSRF